MRWLPAAFHQVLMTLAEGGERAPGRLAAVGQVVERAAHAGKLAARRAGGCEAIAALRCKSEAQREQAARYVEAFGRWLEEVPRRDQQDAPVARGGRQEGVEALRQAEAAI